MTAGSDHPVPRPPDNTRVSKGPRGLSRQAIIAPALAFMEEVGEANFSLRKLAERVGCDPMAILYHFRNKEGLYRALAEALVAMLPAVSRDLPWCEKLRQHAEDYRALALRFPSVFPLVQRFLSTGPSDFAHIEMVHSALNDAGIPPQEAPAICLFWYASVIGLCMGELTGLIRPAGDAEASTIAALPEETFPLLRARASFYRRLEAERVFEVAHEVIMRGISARAALSVE